MTGPHFIVFRFESETSSCDSDRNRAPSNLQATGSLKLAYECLTLYRNGLEWWLNNVHVIKDVLV